MQLVLPDTLYLPVEQLLQAALPKPDAYVPAEQFRQGWLSGMDLYVPGKQ